MDIQSNFFTSGINREPDALGNLINEETVKIPDLDWTKIDFKNIPSEFKVKVIPQLVNQWSNIKESNFNLITSYNEAPPLNNNKDNKDKKNKDKIKTDVVNKAKKLMMLGYSGKELSDELSKLYTKEAIELASDELKKLADEQGLLGKVYLDFSPFNSCSEAMNVLGKNRVRLAKYIINSPTKSCATHKEGFCCVFNKKVVDKVDYTNDLLREYSDHLKLAGIMDSSEKLSSRDDLKEVLLRVKRKTEENKGEEKKETNVDVKKIKQKYEEIKEDRDKKALEREEESRFLEIRPILACVQNLMLKGKRGEGLKECIRQKFPEERLRKCVNELKRMIALEGLLGNVYVDVSYYDTPEEAISAISNAETHPLYVVQTRKENEFDDTLERVCRATGCSILPRDGRIEKNVAVSYLQDLYGNKYLSDKEYNDFVNRINAGDSTVELLKEAFDKVKEKDNEKKPVPIGGVKGELFIPMKKDNKVPENKIVDSIKEAIKKKIPVEDVKDKVASIVGSSKDAMSMVENVLSETTNVHASILSNCANKVYKLNKNVSIIQGQKCITCLYNNANISCSKQKVSFLSDIDFNKRFSFDPKDINKIVKKT